MVTTDCEILNLLNLVGKKWTFPILQAIRHKRRLTFTEIEDLFNQEITPRALSYTLQELTKFNIIKKSDLSRKSSRRSKTCYQLTKPGKKLERMLRTISAWAAMNDIWEPEESVELKCYECKYFCNAQSE
ncbi:MAG: winged helix-turn-helix transcriptional regulator [Nanoarchaeota archaeon]